MDAEIAWAAGFFEHGLALRREGRVPRLQIRSTTEERLHRFIAAVDSGTIYGPYDYTYKDGHVRKPYFLWIADGEHAAKAAERLKPYLSGSMALKVDLIFDGDA